jgi:heme/copper-type cytochrome/quinol oxidase subunit 4
MVGLSTDDFSNMDPPTIAIVALMVWQIGAAMVLRYPVSRWLARARNWAGVIYVNSVIMTMFLWHLTAMLFGIGILFPLGFPQPEAGTAQWWVLRPVWVALLLVLLAIFIVGFGRFEQRGLRPSRETVESNRMSSRLAAALGGALVILGVLGFAMGGLHQLFSIEGTELIIFNLNPLQNVLHLALGGLFLGASIRSDETIRIASFLGAVVLAVLVVVGLAMADGGLTNYLAANTADNVLHLVALSITGAVAFSLRRQPEKRPV